MRSLLNTVVFIKKVPVTVTFAFTTVKFAFVFRCISIEQTFAFAFVAFTFRTYPVCFCQFPKNSTWAAMRNKKSNWYGLIYAQFVKEELQHHT